MLIVTIHITRARAQHEKCSQKHGGLWPLLTPEWRHSVIGIIWESQSCRFDSRQKCGCIFRNCFWLGLINVHKIYIVRLDNFHAQK